MARAGLRCYDLAMRLRWPVLACAASVAVFAGAAPADTQAEFLRLIDRPRVALEARVEAGLSEAGLVETRFSYASDATTRVPGLIVKSATAGGGRRAVVVDLHGTGGNQRSDLPFLRQLAGAGFLAVSIDAPWHGERADSRGKAARYQDAIFEAWQAGDRPHGHPFFYDTVWDVMRLLDFLETRSDVDPQRIGLYGVSKGGIETYLTAAVEPRIAVAVSCLGVQGFGWAIEHDAWRSRIETIQSAFDRAARQAGVANPGPEFVRDFYARVAPGLDGQFDGPALVPLVAPRPLMVINGDSDARTPLPALALATEAARRAYRAAGAEDRLLVRIQENTGHKVTPESQQAALAWFARWLKP